MAMIDGAVVAELDYDYSLTQDKNSSSSVLTREGI